MLVVFGSGIWLVDEEKSFEAENSFLGFKLLRFLRLGLEDVSRLTWAAGICVALFDVWA